MRSNKYISLSQEKINFVVSIIASLSFSKFIENFLFYEIVKKNLELIGNDCWTITPTYIQTIFEIILLVQNNWLIPVHLKMSNLILHTHLKHKDHIWFRIKTTHRIRLIYLNVTIFKTENQHEKNILGWCRSYSSSRNQSAEEHLQA